MSTTQRFVAVAAGGAGGALARFGVSIFADSMGIASPWATVAVNIVGCLLMGLLVAAVIANPARRALWQPLLGVGLLGGFTTFSAFAADSVMLLDDEAWVAAATYILATLAGGLLALRAGVILGERLRGHGGKA